MIDILEEKMMLEFWVGVYTFGAVLSLGLFIGASLVSTNGLDGWLKYFFAMVITAALSWLIIALVAGALLQRLSDSFND